MKEKDYIRVSDLARIRVMEDILREIIVENNAIVATDEYRMVATLLARWRSKLVDLIHAS